MKYILFEQFDKMKNAEVWHWVDFDETDCGEDNEEKSFAPKEPKKEEE